MTKGLVIAAPHSGSGKTTFTMGLAAALKARGTKLQLAKGGPGYIDHQFLSAAIDVPCANLDKWAMGTEQLRARAGEIAKGADLLLVEGMMGMYDGAAGMNGSTADVADALDLPVILLIDASGQAQSIAALVHGFATLRDRPNICGVVANRVGSPRHADMIRDALVETGIPLFGAIHRSEALTIPSRHLGLVQAVENTSRAALIETAKTEIGQQVDLDAVLAHAGLLKASSSPKRLPPLGQRIAIAHDIAFSFTYPHLLLDWQANGAEIELFSPLKNEAPSEACDAVFLPGGYPELHCGTLAQADRFLGGLKHAATRGARIYGECGGYMVLGQGLVDADGHRHAMAGLLSHATSFAERQLHLGYRVLDPIGETPWPACLNGHEFHYSKLLDPGSDEPLFQAADAQGQKLGTFGGRRGAVMGSYMHIIDAA